MGTKEAIMPPYLSPQTKIIAALPPSEIKDVGNISMNGNLLVSDKILMVFSYNEIAGYDVSTPSAPAEKWRMDINGSVVGSRLMGGKLYLITQNYVDQYNPCPIIPVARNGVAVEIACPMIYHPVGYVSADSTYSTMIINPATGSVEKAVSFVGSAYSSVVYMSDNAIYVTYPYAEDYFKTYSDFLSEKMGDLLPSSVLDRLAKLSTYDISDQAKLTEMTVILGNYQSTLSPDDRLKFENEMNNRMADFMDEHKRELQGTGIVKVGLDMTVASTGLVPGTPLNQFALDEYNGYLRIATTIGGWSNTTNDVYVLDGGLKVVGSLQDIDQGERIYSARFVQDKGYLVTFKQTDPFFVLDLSDPSNPQVKGELKIPGYSSYLHPISADRILGIGMENSNVKLSLFDVSSPGNPTEVSHYLLNEYWSEAMSNHHAFLQDSGHKIFFIPGGNGGYIFSYENDNLTLKKAVSGINSERALYIGDYLYIVGSNKIVVLDENSWEQIGSLEF
jgi:inhibitor of cysteine peptidase